MLEQLKNIPAWIAELEGRNTGTLWQAVKAYRANLRQGTVGVKTRAMVSSTGKKPYKQKKTGSARRGSFVSPLHIGGGVAHGPKARDYREALPKKMTNLALGIALQLKAKSGGIFVGETATASGKTKDAAAKLTGVGIGRVGKTIVCLSSADEATMRAYRNIRGVVLMRPENLNAWNVMQARALVTTPDALKVIETRVTANG